MSKLLRAALYHRVSTRDQDKTLARAELRQAAAARGYEVALDIEETGSGRRNDRPGLQQILEAVRRHQVEAVLVWKLDRFGRSLVDLLANLDELRRCGVRFIATSQGIEQGDRGDATTSFLLRILGAAAELERDLISERTHLGLAEGRKRGRVGGRPRRALPKDEDLVELVDTKGLRGAARALKVPLSTLRDRLRCAKKGTPGAPSEPAPENGLSE